MRGLLYSLIAVVTASVSASAYAEVVRSDTSGFVSHNEVLVPVPADRAWAMLLIPRAWWNGEHTYSGDPAQLTLEAEPGGCFCERVPGENRADAQVEHMRVIYVAPYETLRMTGGLGPLQSEAVTGVLTISLESEGEYTRIAWDYVVGGYMRMPVTEIAPVVDRVVGEQLQRLAARLSPVIDDTRRRF